MKPKKQPNGAKARVMYAAKPELADAFVVADSPKMLASTAPATVLLVLPLPTKRAALAKKKWEGLSYGDKADAIATALMNHDSSPPRYWSTCRKFSAPAILALTGEPSP